MITIWINLVKRKDVATVSIHGYNEDELLEEICTIAENDEKLSVEKKEDGHILFRNPIAKSVTFIEQLQNFFNISKDDKVKYFSFVTNAYTDEEAENDWHKRFEKKNG